MSIILYMLFRIFNYYYPNNYCSFLSSNAIENSVEDIKETRKCIYTLVCEIWDISISTSQNSKEEKLKSFSCVRKYKPWVWNW